MKPMQYIAVTLPGNREKHYVGRLSVDGKRVVVQFEAPNLHEANVLTERLEFAREHLGDMEGTAVTAPTIVTDEQRQKFKDGINRFRSAEEKIE